MDDESSHNFCERNISELDFENDLRRSNGEGTLERDDGARLTGGEDCDG